MLLVMTSPGMGFTACTGAQGGPGHVVWGAGIVLSHYFVSHPGKCYCKSFGAPCALHAYSVEQSVLHGFQADLDLALHKMHVSSCLVSGLYQLVLA